MASRLGYAGITRIEPGTERPACLADHPQRADDAHGHLVEREAASARAA